MTWVEIGLILAESNLIRRSWSSSLGDCPWISITPCSAGCLMWAAASSLSLPSYPRGHVASFWWWQLCHQLQRQNPQQSLLHRSCRPLQSIDRACALKQRRHAKTRTVMNTGSMTFRSLLNVTWSKAVQRSKAWPSLELSMYLNGDWECLLIVILGECLLRRRRSLGDESGLPWISSSYAWANNKSSRAMSTATRVSKSVR